MELDYAIDLLIAERVRLWRVLEQLQVKELATHNVIGRMNQMDKAVEILLEYKEPE